MDPAPLQDEALLKYSSPLFSGQIDRGYGKKSRKLCKKIHSQGLQFPGQMIDSSPSLFHFPFLVHHFQKITF